MVRRFIQMGGLRGIGVTFLILSCIACGSVAYGEVPSIAVKPYQVFSFNDLGMHCYDSDYSVFTILPPFNTLHAQIVKRGIQPVVLDDTKVNVSYFAMKDPTGSINKTSGSIGGVSKTNFWDHVSSLFGLTLSVNQGIPVPPPDGPSSWMPGPLNKKRSFAQGYNPDMKWFTAAGIPITQWDDKLKLNPYPLMKVQAFKGITSIGGLPTVVPISYEMNCSDCHATGGMAADAAVQQKYNITAWSSSADPVIQFKENVLILHDAVNLTALSSSKPVLCAWCHYSPALDLAGSGPPPGNTPFMSRAIHGFHGQLLDGNNNPIFERTRSTNNNACFECHPGPITQCFRGAMATAGLVCIDCHGNMLAVGGVGQVTPRYPWVDLPLCQSCHTGDAVDNFDGQLVRRTAYADSPDVATFIVPTNKRFAEQAANPGYPGKYGYNLYRNSLGHKIGDIACESCHGSPHAEWPTRAGNDNLTAKAIQGHGGKIIECGVCHGGGLPLTLGGPHGMHNVNSNAWVKGHETFFDASRAECQACHGVLGHGTALSMAAADRLFQGDEIGTVRIPKGTQVHCAMCHENKLAN
jgi:hypothetical protein